MDCIGRDCCDYYRRENDTSRMCVWISIYGCSSWDRRKEMEHNKTCGYYEPIGAPKRWYGLGDTSSDYR